ncbi:MAG: LysR family transcriptional regulator substrate-binding protein [Actinomycetota bacterium]|nr:LysR family transcriptional regulator substrate-binding protein [Actinomycetota bacterium]
MFHRSRGEVTLTAAGEALLPWARQVQADCDAAQAAVRELLGLRGGRLALGATPSLTTNLLPPLLVEFHRRHPGVALIVHEAGSGDLVTRLEQGELDVAIVILPITEPWVQTTPLLEEELVLAVHPGHHLANRRSLDLSELRDEPLVMFRDGYDLREVTTQACREAGFEPVAALEGLEMDGVLALTAAGLGASVLPASVVHHGRRALRAVRFKGRVLTRTVGLAARRDRPLSQAAQAFVNAIVTATAAP